MIKIYKYPLAIIDRQIIKMPWGALLLSAGLDAGGDLCVWGVVDAEGKESANVLVMVVGTGIPADILVDRGWGRAHHLGTVTMPPFVWHVFCDSAVAYAGRT